MSLKAPIRCADHAVGPGRDSRWPGHVVSRYILTRVRALVEVNGADAGVGRQYTGDGSKGRGPCDWASLPAGARRRD
jgi:hypothetical protein